MLDENEASNVFCSFLVVLCVQKDSFSILLSIIMFVLYLGNTLKHMIYKKHNALLIFTCVLHTSVIKVFNVGTLKTNHLQL